MGFLDYKKESYMSILRKIRYWLFPCKHNWVQAAEYWHNKTGNNYYYLLPEPMLYHPEYQTNCYVCDKCKRSIVVIEEVKTNMPIGVVIDNK